MEFERCLCCGKVLDEATAFYHKSCAKKLFGSQQIPALNYTLEELNELAKKRFFDGLCQNTQKNRKNRKTELKKTGIAPIV